MPWRGKKRGRAGYFHNLPGIHQSDLVRHLGHDSQIMGNEQHGHFLALLQLFKQVQNLRLDSHVQGGGGFVGNHQIGLGCQRNGNHDALLLSA